MSDAAVSLLTAPGSAAIAVIEVRGPRAYSLAKQLFVPAGKPLPESPDVGRFWFGTLGSDEVVLSVTAADAVEVHCHGGPRVVRWVMDALASRNREGAGGRAESAPPTAHPLPHGRGSPAEFLQHAPTLRTASVLLDQLSGAFAGVVRQTIAALEADPTRVRASLHGFALVGRTVGRHLVEPWKVVFAGAPNAGKSSLVNALAGYQRAVVSEVAGTTRDAVGVRLAFDGWPFELTDTAGIRDAEGLEAEGVARTERELLEADLVVWVLDGTAAEPVWPPGPFPKPQRYWFVVNKADQVLQKWTRTEADDVPGVSAVTGAGLSGLIDGILTCTVGAVEVAPGDAVPFTPRLIELVDAANAALTAGQPTEAAHLLREALALAE